MARNLKKKVSEENRTEKKYDILFHPHKRCQNIIAKTMVKAYSIQIHKTKAFCVKGTELQEFAL